MQDTAFGKYRLIAKLGQGGMAEVFLAVVTGPAGFNKLQVVKKLRSELTEDAEHLAMFLDEARLAARLNHRNVVQTFEVGEEEGTYYLTMEYLEGAPFNRVLGRARLNPPAEGILLRIVADALAGLHYAHELKDYDGSPLKIVHRDASPHNIFVCEDGTTKLVDFGIAKAATRSNETRMGVVKGKVTYMAPEQARSAELDCRADIFVLGIVLWEVIAGRKMWDRAPDLEVLQKLALAKIPRLEDVVPDAPPELIAICNRALAPDPEDRFATALDMRNEILAYMDRAKIKLSTEDVGEYVSNAFADKRTDIKGIIERQIAKLSQGALVVTQIEEASPDSLNLPRLDLGTGRISITGSGGSGRRSDTGSDKRGTGSGKRTTGSGKSNPSQQSIPPVGARTQTNEMELEEPEQRRDKRLYVAVVGMALFAALAGFFFLRAQKSAATSVQTVVAAPSALAAPSLPPAESFSAAPVNSAVAAVEKGAMIEVKVKAIPSNAEIFLDGARLPGNPYTGKFPADGVGHKLHAEAEDYRTAGEIVTFDRDASIDLVLERKIRTVKVAGAAEESSSSSSSSATVATNPADGTAKKPKRALGGGDSPWTTAPAPTTTTTTKRQLGGADPW
jgi:serine/threonine-protein kinase